MASRSIGVGGASNAKRVVEGISVAGATVVAPDATVVGTTVVGTTVVGTRVVGTTVVGTTVVGTTVVEGVTAGRATGSGVSEPQEAAAAKSAATTRDVGDLRTSR